MSSASLLLVEPLDPVDLEVLPEVLTSTFILVPEVLVAPMDLEVWDLLVVLLDLLVVLLDLLVGLDALAYP